MKARAEVAPVTWRQLRNETAEAIADPVQARWLLEEASGLDGARLLRELDSQAPPAAVARLESFVRRRLAGEPLQHVLGHWGFRSLDVVVDSRVLVPRPETEVVVSLALSQLDRLSALHTGPELLAVDLGTGSGVIALSLVVERHAVRVIATRLLSRSPPSTCRASDVRRRRGCGFARATGTKHCPPSSPVRSP